MASPISTFDWKAAMSGGASRDAARDAIDAAIKQEHSRLELVEDFNMVRYVQGRVSVLKEIRSKL